jgi:hypothetical protein
VGQDASGRDVHVDREARDEAERFGVELREEVDRAQPLDALGQRRRQR